MLEMKRADVGLQPFAGPDQTFERGSKTGYAHCLRKTLPDP